MPPGHRATGRHQVPRVPRRTKVQPLDIVKTRFQLSREANPKLQGTQMYRDRTRGPYSTCLSIEELDRLGEIVRKKPFDLNFKTQWNDWQSMQRGLKRHASRIYMREADASGNSPPVPCSDTYRY